MTDDRNPEAGGQDTRPGAPLAPTPAPAPSGGTSSTSGSGLGSVTPTTGGGTVAHGIPEPDEAVFWSIDGVIYVVYMVPESDPPIPMAWKVGDRAALDAIQPGAQVLAMSGSNADARGMTFWGDAIELDNTTEHPFKAFVALIEDQAAIRPWLRDPEVLTLIAQATLEGRIIADAEFHQTEWWRTHNAAQRAWLLKAEDDPQEAARIMADNKFQAESDLFEHGILDAPPELIDHMATQVTMGNWSVDYYSRQMKAISDPNLGFEIDEGLLEVMGGNIDVGTNQQFEDAVRALVSTWLGPTLGNWSQAEVGRWASRFRETPDARAELEEELRRQRLSLFPEYENPDLTYQDIATPWKAKWSQMWGQTADETDPLFMEIIRLNDSTAAGRRLTEEGLNRGVRKVRQGAQLAMDQSFRNAGGVVPGPR